MQAVDATPVAPAEGSAGATYQLDRNTLQAEGRWRSRRRTLILTVSLFLLQMPMWLVATGRLTPVQPSPPTKPIPTEVPARLSLLVDAVMILAYLVLAIRQWEIARWAPGRKKYTRPAATVALVMVAAGAVLDAVEDVHLWGQVASATGKVTLEWPPLTTVMRALVVVGLILGFLVAAHARRQQAPPDGAAEPGQDDGAPAGAGGAPNQPGLIVCCSGGGIRAASFCLGGLQALEDRYRRANAVVGVSGGGYMAAAFHVHRWKSKDVLWDEWGERGRLPYTPGSPEERWLRRHTRYLFDSPAAGTSALLSLLFGLAVNLLYITALLGACAWVFGWFLTASGAITDWKGEDTAFNQYQGDWAWVRWAWVVPAAGVALFLGTKIWDKVVGKISFQRRGRIRTYVAYLVLVGLALVAALLVLPAVIVALHDFARGQQTSELGKALANLLGTLGFGEAPATGQGTGSSGGGASGVAVSATSLAAIAAAVLATVKAIASTLSPEDEKKGSGVGKWLGMLWTKVKKVVIPWVAAVAVVVLLGVVFLTWTVGLLNNPADLQRWLLAGIYGGLVLATLVVTDANRTSLHHYYRERLCSAYLVGHNEMQVPEELDYTQPLRFSASSPGDGGPKLVSCAVANVRDPDVVPTGRDCVPFVFSHDTMGLTEEILPAQAMTPSVDYEFAADSRGRDATIPAAVAISGAAFSPLVGRENAKVRPYRLVLALANARLGVWLPNPLWVDSTEMTHRRERAGASAGWRFLEKLRDVVTKPNPFLVGREAFGRTSVLDRFLYVTDGGHYDNLGLVEALRRRPKVVVVLDASNDDEDSYATLGQAIATARMDLGCEVDFDPRGMRRDGDKRAASPFGYGRIRYRPVGGEDPQTGELWLAKAVMVDDLSWDLETYDTQHADFPRASTGNQFYGEFDLEAYRALGAATVTALLKKAEARHIAVLTKDGWPPPDPDSTGA